jgi:hypothetical protein
MDITNLTPEDAQNIADGLAALPLAKAYNTFNKVMQQIQAANAPPGPAGTSGMPPLASLVPPGTMTS